MLISIPKEFFVPVLFSKEFRLNEETGQMEYDTEKRCNSIKENINVDLDMVRKLTISKDGIDEVKKEMEILLDKSFESINKVVNILTPDQIKKMNIEDLVDVNINKFKENYKLYLNNIINSKDGKNITERLQYGNEMLDLIDEEYIEESIKWK